ncbi:MAG: hypothetical protein ABI134_34615 [Byssovorax sp.]
MTTNEDEAEDRIDAAIDRIYAGEAAIAAIARGESVDPELVGRAADELANLLGPGVTATWTPEDIERVRRLRTLITGGAPSPEARALATAYAPFFFAQEENEERAAQRRQGVQRIVSGCLKNRHVSPFGYLYSHE